MSHRHAVRTLPAAALALVVGAATFVAAAGPATAAESWPVQDGDRITVSGHGNGHGHGLSQYGAEGAARKGLSYRRIVNFYFPGTRWGTAGGSVKVLISADTSRDVQVKARSGLRVRSLASGKRWQVPTKVGRKQVRRWRIMPGSGRHSVVSYRTGGWHRWRVVGGDAEFSAGARPVKLYTPAGVVAYRGALRSASPSGSRTDRDTVNVVSLEGYLQGVVPSEVFASTWHASAIRAQTVAARTYAAYERAHAPRSRHYQICDTAHCQVYGGYSAEYPTSNDAVRATARRILTARGAPAFAQFSASNGGWTSAGAFGYLPAKKDPYDGWSGNPYGAAKPPWQTRLTKTDVEKQWPALGGDLTSISIDARDGHGSWNGRVETITMTGGGGQQVTVSGDTFRTRFGLRSTLFTLSVG